MELDYSKIMDEFKNNSMMLDNIERLQEFEIYHYLLEGSREISNAIINKYNIKLDEFRIWLKYCNGGLLFDTVLLAMPGDDQVDDFEFNTYDEYNNDKEIYGLAEKYCIIAVRSYGDLICVNTEEADDKVYLFSIETGDFSDVWASFTDWLAEEIDEAIKLIAEEVLDPIPAKLEE